MKAKKLAAAAAALTMIASMAAVPMSVSADDTTPGTSGYTAVNGGDVSFDKYLVMKNNATVPNVSFNLTVEPIADSEVKTATSTSLAVMKGPEGIKFKSGVTDVTVVDATETTPATATVAFNSTDTTTPEANKESKSIVFATTTTDDEKFATKTVTLDLSAVSFPEPGVYRYKITETAVTGVAGVTNDTNDTRYLDVYVKNETTGTGAEETNTGNLAIQGYFIHKADDAPRVGTADSSKKSTGFSNAYTTNDLEFRKVVTGNQGSKDKYFKITVKLTNPDSLTISDSDTFQLSGTWTKTPTQNAATIYTAENMTTANNVTSLTYANLKGTDGYSFYIHDGELIELHGIPSGLGYTIIEAEEDYTPSVAMNTTGDVKTDDKAGEGTAIDTSANNTVTDTFLKSDAGVIFTNDRSGNIPTGLISTVAGSLGIVAVGALGITGGAIYMKKKKSEDEED
ncbi:MAG: hypothetical protein K5979_14205 [Ruminococcus sp.]|nr:hypothetical protein [Ruminococcus sp.]